MKQCAFIYYRKDNIFISTMSNGPGANVGTGDPSVLKSNSHSIAIGTFLLNALAKSRPTGKLPENLSDLAIPLLRAAQVNSWRTFIQGCKAIDVERNDNQMQLRLLKREGTNFVLGPEPEILENPSPEELGVAVQRLFRIKTK